VRSPENRTQKNGYEKIPRRDFLILAGAGAVGMGIGCSSAFALQSPKPSQPKLMELTDEEKTKPYAKYYYKKLAPIPEDVIKAIRSGPMKTELALLFENKNDLLNPGYHAVETGYCTMPDNSYYVAVLTKMPNVTGEMLDWWFTWQALEDLRYKIWFPGSHLGISVKDREQLTNTKLSYRERYWNNPQYPVEDVGIGKDTLSINFIPPKDFGFDISRFKEANVAGIVCAVVGSETKKTQHTHMCHFVRNIEGGVEMRSRFWIGHNLKVKFASEGSIINRILNTQMMRRLVIPKGTGYSMALHCAQEYNNLAEILPDLYKEYSRA